MEEIWKDIPGYEKIYQVSNLGRIRSAPGKITSSARHKKRVWKTRVLKPKQEKSRYRHDYRVSLWKDGKPKDYLVSRLVALTWCEGYKDGMTVNHIDGNYLNNRFDNLEWVTLSENIKHAFRNGLCSSFQKKVRLIDKNNNFIDFPSLSEASRYLGRNNRYLHGEIKRGHIIRGKNGKIYDYKFI